MQNIGEVAMSSHCLAAEETIPTSASDSDQTLTFERTDELQPGSVAQSSNDQHDDQLEMLHQQVKDRS